MDVLALLEQASEAGLNVTVAGGKLVMKGPQRLAALAKMIGDHKEEAIAAIQGDTVAKSLICLEVQSQSPLTTNYLLDHALHLDTSTSGDGDTTSPIPEKNRVLSPPLSENSTSVGADKRATDKPAAPTLRCRRCGCAEFTDTPIHKGQSIRRDCARCGRLFDFPVWYGASAGVRV